MDMLLQDVRYAARSLWRAPALTLTALLCLALGIGVNTGAFSVVHAMLFRPLPFAHADRIVSVLADNAERSIIESGVPYADLEDLRSTGVFEDAQGLVARNFTLMGGDQSERVEGSAITPGLFAMLGVQPRIGRDFLPEEAGPAGFERAVLLSDALWRRRYNGDAGIVGRTVLMNGRELVVAGVMPPGFRFPDTDEIWVPFGVNDATNRNARPLFVVARLRANVTPGTAGERVAALARRNAEEYAGSHRGWTYNMRPFREAFIDAPAQRLLIVMLGAVAFVLLIACANVANLLLARATDRRREVTVRAALGASRARVVRLFLIESLLLALTGGALGVLFAVWWVEAMTSRIPEEMAYWIRFAIDGPVLVYTLLIALGTGILFGIMPALQAARVDLHSDLKEGARTIGDARGRARLRAALVTAEVALSVVLLAGAALMMQSFLRLQQAEIGFDDHSIYSVRVLASGDHYDDPAARAAFYHTALERIATLPGVVAAAATVSIPADDGGPGMPLRIEDRAEPIAVTTYASTSGFFDALGVRLVAGRTFTASESSDTAAYVAIVGQALAVRLWPDGDAIGRRIRLGMHAETESYIVVGIAPDLQYEELGEDRENARLQVHLPYARRSYRQMALLVRTQGDPVALKQPVRAALRSVDASLAPFDELTMRERRRFTTWPQRIFGQTFGVFGTVALLLAVIGVYGVMSYTVAQRRREIGIRMALGARPGDVLRQVVGRAARMGAAGVVIGTIVALAVVRLLEGIIFGVSLTDPLTFLGVPAVLLAAATLAGYVPARRAARVDPLHALRSE